MDNIHDIKDYYTTYNENMRLERHQLERDMTLRYFTEYLPPKGHILEIGAASGFYTLWLSKNGYSVTAVDISEKLLNECREHIIEANLDKKVDFIVADARDLSAVQKRDYDAVLMMGPLYHLIYKTDRIKALREAILRLRPDGIFLSALISRYGVIGHIMQNVPDWIESQQHVRSLIETGRDPDEGPKYGFRAYYTTVDEIAPLHEEAGLETIDVMGIEPAISADDKSYNALSGQRRKLWLDLLYELSNEPSLKASSRHLLYVGRKQGDPTLLRASS